MPARAADPIKVGFSMALTGSVAQNGKQLIMALELWRDDINASGGLLCRPVELVYYDDQSNPSDVPGIYTKLITVDKVDLLLGPYATNMAAAAVPVIMQHNMTTISILAVDVNRHFHYSRYFDMIPVGPEGTRAFSKGFFALAAAQKPRPQTVAIVSADAEFSKTSADGARENANAEGFKIIYDQGYPPSTTDFAPVMRAVQAANPDIVFVAAYPPDTVGIVRAAKEIGLTAKMFGGTMVGLLATPLKVQMGPLMNGYINNAEVFVPVPGFNFPGVKEVLQKYQERAKGQGIDPFGYNFVPYGYAAAQVLGMAVEATKSLDHAKVADALRSSTFKTVVGDVAFGKDGEWAKPRTVVTQWRNLTGNDLGQLTDLQKWSVVWPAEYRNADLVYPYEAAKK